MLNYQRVWLHDLSMRGSYFHPWSILFEDPAPGCANESRDVFCKRGPDRFTPLVDSDLKVLEMTWHGNDVTTQEMLIRWGSVDHGYFLRLPMVSSPMTGTRTYWDHLFGFQRSNLYEQLGHPPVGFHHFFHGKDHVSEEKGLQEGPGKFHLFQYNWETWSTKGRNDSSNIISVMAVGHWKQSWKLQDWDWNMVYIHIYMCVCIYLYAL